MQNLKHWGTLRLIQTAATLLFAWPIAGYFGLTKTIDQLSYHAYHMNVHWLVIMSWYAMVFGMMGVALRVVTLLATIPLVWAAAVGLAAPVQSRAAEAISRVTTTITALLLLPLRMVWEATYRPLENWLFDKLNALETERTLRAEYRRNFRGRFATYAAFKRAYYGQDDEKTEEEKPKPPPAADTLADAYALLGLTPSCTAADLKSQHRKLMKACHPDAGGTAALAARINNAKETIARKRGWK